MNTIRIPSGTRDLVGLDVRKKRYLQSMLHKIFASYGFEEIMTPALEYYQTYNMAFSSLKDSEMYKFFDENGDILALRVDMTVPIARAALSRFPDAPRPLRLQYASNVYKVRAAFAGKRSEVMDCGVEMIGASAAYDTELLSLALEVMESLGFSSYTLEIGNSNFFSMAANLILPAQSDVEKLADLVDHKSMVELKEFLSSLQLSAQIQSFFMELPLLSGGIEAVQKAYELAFTPALQKIAADLMELYAALDALGLAEHVSFDFGKVPHLDYYTGIIFEGFVEGVGFAVLSGGRYDNLLAKFGQDMPACGFSVKLDYLLDSLKLPETRIIRCKIYTPKEKMTEALRLAARRRQEGLPVSIYEVQDEEMKEILTEEIAS